jgi:signal transduction histidine kinase
VLGEVQTDARALLTDLRELAHGIHPPVLSDRGLVAAIESRADRLPIPVTVRAGGLADRRFGVELEGAAYFVVCEALTNVVKHAAAATAEVDITCAHDRLRIVVRDDGVGLATGRDGQGLTNLRDRVDALGGDLQVTGAPGAGTTVTASLPVDVHRG